MRSVNVRVPVARRILDFGCGTGWVLAEAQTEGNPDRYGVDYSIGSLRGENGVPQLQRDRENPPMTFILADGLKLPFCGEAFDVVIGHVSLPYMNTNMALREIFRVLAPGGSILLTFHSFYYLRQRLLECLRRGNWKALLHTAYVGTNGLMNHWSLPQRQVWWKPGTFETVNTPRGVHKAALKAGFILVSIEHATDRIFFAATARKPNLRTGEVLPAPSWASYCQLARAL